MGIAKRNRGLSEKLLFLKRRKGAVASFGFPRALSARGPPSGDVFVRLTHFGPRYRASVWHSVFLGFLELPGQLRHPGGALAVCGPDSRPVDRLKKFREISRLPLVSVPRRFYVGLYVGHYVAKLGGQCGRNHSPRSSFLNSTHHDCIVADGLIVHMWPQFLSSFFK